ncbi:MAG: hypothetical protein QOK43_791 [Acidimicrobiaceae bacterium]|nr:hypothetical protein [Acidimicrobiaceae bacterium]
MIDPGVAIVDVDPEAFAHLNAVLSKRDRSGPSSVTVVHDGIESVGDLASLRQAHGVDEVVLLDRRGLDDLSGQLVELARQTDDQGDLLVQCRQAYVGHWAVTIVPPPATTNAVGSGPAEGESGWAPVQRLLASVPDGQWVAAMAGEWSLAAQVRGGRIVRITSDWPADAVMAASLRGPVAAFDEVLSAPDPLAALRTRVASGEVAIDVREGIEWPA